MPCHPGRPKGRPLRTQVLLHRGRSYHGIVRFEYFRPISAAFSLAEPIITPSLIMSTTLSAFMLFRKKILLAFVAAKTFARAACNAGGIGPGPLRTPSENAMSPGPHSANAIP